MAAESSSAGIAWLGLAALTAVVAGDPEGLINAGSRPKNSCANPGTDIITENDFGKDPARDFRPTAALDGVLFSRSPDQLIQLLRSVPDPANVRNFRRNFEGQSSSTLLSLSPPHSPPHSPPLWAPTASEHFEYGETSLLTDADTNDAFSSYEQFDREFNLPKMEFESQAFDVPIDYIPLRRLKGKVDDEEDEEQHLEHPLQGIFQAEDDLDGGTGSFVQAFERSQLQEELQTIRQGPPARSAIQHIRFADKIHRKRAKRFINPRRHPSSTSSRGASSLAFSNSPQHHSLQSDGWEKGGLSLGPPSYPPSRAQGDGQGTLQSGNAGEDDEEDNVEEMEDNEPRMDLTDDLLLKVFSFLDHVTLCHAAMVCRQWRATSAHEDFWKSLNFEFRQVNRDQVAGLCARYPKATELHLKGAPCVDEGLVCELIKSLRNLEVLTLGRSFLSEVFFYDLFDRASLQKLSITKAILGSGGAQEIQLRHEGLRHLQIVECRVLRIAIRCPQLESLSLKGTGTASAILHCPFLTSLDVSYCHKLSDAGVRAAAIACPLLACLDMSNCAYVTDDTLREISLVCTHLRTLNASYCPNISLEGVRMPMLTDLTLQGCEGINSSSMAALSHCVMLEVLAMDTCWLLTSVNLDLPRLRSVSLRNNRKLVEVTLRSPALVLLDLNSCPTLNLIDLTSSSVQRLELKQQSGLANMALHCPWLREVDLTDCESLTDSVCNVFSDGGGCPKLNSLILDNCDGLVKVKLSTTSLEKLSLAGCKKVSSLKLSCPILQHLHLDGCDRLIDASFAPVGLQSLNLGICPHLTNLEIEAEQMTALDLRGCGVLSQASIRCPSLSSLDASYCSQLGDDCLAATTSASPAIQCLVLAACFEVGPAGLLALKRLVALTTLDLSYTFLTDLSPIFKACPRLKVLRLSACKYLDETALDALHARQKLPELEELDISYGSLGRKAIEGVLALCPHLIHVSLNGCTHVTDDLWSHLCSSPLPFSEGFIQETGMMDASTPDSIMEQCSPINLPLGHEVGSPEDCDTAEESSTKLTEAETEVGHSIRALQSLSCVGCPNIRTVLVPSDTCLHLSFLNLSLSNNIREVFLACINLTSLNLSNCAALVVLELDCPRLITLCLQACGIEAEMLKHALHGCTSLETLDVRNCSKVSAAQLTVARAVCPGIKRLYSTSS